MWLSATRWQRGAGGGPGPGEPVPGLPLPRGAAGARPTLYRLALAPGVPGDPAHGHLDAEPGGSALLFGLTTPEAVLTVLPGPAPARRHHRAGVTDRAGLG